MKCLTFCKKGAVAVALCILLTPLFTHAQYDSTNCKIEEDGTYTLTNGDGPVGVVVVVAYQEGEESRVYPYEFECVSADFENGDEWGTMSYPLNALNYQPFTEYGELSLYRYTFKIEEGTYRFTQMHYPLTSSKVYTLMDDLTSPFDPTAYEHSVESVVSEGDVVHVYALVGSEEWGREALPLLQSYASKEEHKKVSKAQGSSTTIRNGGLSEEDYATAKATEDALNAAVEEAREAYESYSPTPTPSYEGEFTGQTGIKEEPEWKSVWKRVAPYAGGLLVIAFAAFVVWIQKR